jgi:hypothetical protein
MKSFLTRHCLTFRDVVDFVVIVLFISTLAVWAALGSGA